MGASDLRIRAVALADLDAIIGIHAAARSAYYRGFVPDQELADIAASARWRDAHQRRIEDPGSTTLCAERDGRVAGFVMLSPPHVPAPDPSVVGQLLQIHVGPEHWRQGLGSALHAATITVWQSASIVTGRVDVWANNARARGFYAAHGWRPDGQRRPGPAGFDYLRLCLTVPRPAVPRPAVPHPGALKAWRGRVQAGLAVSSSAVGSLIQA